MALWGATVGRPTGARPVLVAFEGPVPQHRATIVFRLILAIPAMVVVALVGIAAFFVAVIGWLAALVTGRLPAFAHEFLSGYLRLTVRLDAYTMLLTDAYPRLTLDDVDYPVRVAIPPVEELNRLAVLFRLVIAIPAWVVTNVVTTGFWAFVCFIIWIIVVIEGRPPPGVFQALAATLRYRARFTGYMAMLTSEYPWGLYGDPPGPGASGVTPPWGPGSPSAPGWPGPPPAPGSGVPPWTTTPPPPTPPAPWQGPGPGAASAGPGGPPPPPAAAAPPPFGLVPSEPPGSVPPAASGEVPDLGAPLRSTAEGFTLEGTRYLWGFTGGRTYVGIWSRSNPGGPGQVWPMSEQGEAWGHFRELEPEPVDYTGPDPTAGPTYPGGWPTPAPYPAAPGGPAGYPPYPAGPPATSWGSPPPTGYHPAYGTPAGPATAAPPQGSWPPGPFGGYPADPGDPAWRIQVVGGGRVLLTVMVVWGALFNLLSYSGGGSNSSSNSGAARPAASAPAPPR